MSFSKHRSSTVLSRVHFHSCFFPKENNQIKKPQIRSPFFIPHTQSSHQESIKKYMFGLTWRNLHLRILLTCNTWLRRIIKESNSYKKIYEAISDEQRVGSFKLNSFKNISDSVYHFASYFDKCFTRSINNYFA
jgi:hypothetical protein